MPLDEAIIAEARKRLVREVDRYTKLVRFVEAECVRLVRDHGIPAAVQSRVKKPDSFEGKLRRYLETDNQTKITLMNDVDDVFGQVGDIGAVRVATYVEGDRERVVTLIESYFSGVEIQRHSKPSGYRATHCQVELPTHCQELEDAANILELSCEVQVCSMLAHVWNEVEHDMRYKLDGVSAVDDYEVSRLQALLEVTKDGDTYIEEMLQERALRVAKSLVDAVAAHFPSSPDFGLRAEYVIREAVRLGHATIEAIDEKLLVGDREGRGREMIDHLNRALRDNGEEGHVLNPDTSDIFLALLLHACHADLCALHHKELEGTSPGRVAFLASFIDEHPVSTD